MGEADRRKLNLVLMGRAMLSKSLIQFSVDGWSFVPSLLFIWDKTMVEVMKIMVTSFKRSHATTATLTCPQTCSSPPLTHASTGDSWTLTGKPGSVSCGLPAPFSWLPVHTRFCLCSLRVCFPALCQCWQLHGGVNGDLLQEGLCHTKSAAPTAPIPVAVNFWLTPPQEMLSNTERWTQVGRCPICYWRSVEK